MSDSTDTTASTALVAADPVASRIERGQHPSSMVAKISWLTRVLLTWVLSSVDFSKRAVERVREAQHGASVVYVMPSRSLIDYIYFNVAFLREGLPLVRVANGINAWFLRSALRALWTRVRGRRGFPSDAACIQSAVSQGLPTTVFLTRPVRDEHEEAVFSLPALTALVTLQRQQQLEVRLVPKLLVWEKRPDGRKGSLIDAVFGSRQRPGLIRGAYYVLVNWWRAFVNFGQPVVVVGEPIALRAYVEARASLSDHLVAAELRDVLLDALGRERRVVVGPGVKRARGMRDEILADPRQQDVLTEIAEDRGLQRNALIKQSRAILDEIAADFSILSIKIVSGILAPVFQRIYSGIEVDEEGLDRIRQLAKHKRIVYVPSHKSHVDYLVLSFVLFNYGFIPPHVAAGANLNIWPIGGVFRRSGAFFLRRTFASDPLYAALFNAYLTKLLEEGFDMEFFIEGTRSRTGRLNPPRYGMLNMIVDAFLGGDVNDLAFVPVSIAYEKVIESGAYRREQDGAEKRSENTSDLAKVPAVLTSRYGRVYAHFGEAIGLEAFLGRFHESREDLPREELARTVRRLAYALIHGINDATPVTPSAVAALVVLNSPARAMTWEAIAQEAGFVLSFLRRRGAPMSRSLDDAIEARLATVLMPALADGQLEPMDDFDREFMEELPRASSRRTLVSLEDAAFGDACRVPLTEAMSLLEDGGVLRIREQDGQTLYSVDAGDRAELAYYKNNIVHYFANDAVLATSLFALEGAVIERDDLRPVVLELSRLMKFEFCFQEQARFDEVLDATLDEFDARGWITWDATAGRIERVDPLPAGLEFLRGLMLDALESYDLAARTLAAHPDEWIPPKALVKKGLALGRRLYSEGTLLFKESNSRFALANAFRLFRDWGYIEQREVEGRKRPIRQYRAVPGADLSELQTRTGRFVGRLDRRAGDDLRTA